MRLEQNLFLHRLSKRLRNRLHKGAFEVKCSNSHSNPFHLTHRSQANTPTVLSETVAKFFGPEDPTPPWRWESVEDRCEREARTNFGGWCGG